MKLILAIDGGGTRTRCAAMREDGRLLATSESGPSNHLQVALDVAALSLRCAIDRVLQSAALRPSEIACVSAGLAGVDYNGAGCQEALEIFRSIGYPDVAVHSDMVIAHRGALAGRPGGMALAGTGSVFLGIDESGRTVKAGGWGPLFGDEGSGHWIGAAALRAASQARDGRGPATSLVDVLPRALGVSGFDRVTGRVYRNGARAGEASSLAPAVAAAAREGDAVAAEILREAGKALAAGVLALSRALGWTREAFPVSYQGAVLRDCEPVRIAFQESLCVALPAATLLPPRFEPVVGAFLLGCDAAGIRRPEMEEE